MVIIITVPIIIAPTTRTSSNDRILQVLNKIQDINNVYNYSAIQFSLQAEKLRKERKTKERKTERDEKKAENRKEPNCAFLYRRPPSLARLYDYPSPPEPE